MSEHGRERDADLIVIGGGSAGFAAAIAGHERGARVLLVNDGPIGGTCVNVGCVPSKTLIRAAETLHRAGQPRFAGIETSGRLVDFAAVIAHKDELVASLRRARYEDVLSAYERVRLVRGRARLRAPDAVEVGGRLWRAPRVIVATGARAWIPPVPGLRSSRPLTSTELFALERLPASLVVLGGRYVALECAQMMARFGTRVTILQRSERLLPTEDPDVTGALTAFLRAEGVTVRTGLQLEEVARHADGARVRFATKDGQRHEVEAEQILCATGRRPVTDGLGLDEIGVQRGADGRVLVDETLATSVAGIYAAGDVIGDPAFVYTAAYEGGLAARNALGERPEHRDYTALPWVVFTDPQLAGVGMNERQARERGLAIEVATLGLEHVPRALAARDTRGFIKLIRERGSDRLLGARVLAPEGGEQIMEPALAIRHGLGVSALASAFHPYLTQAEGVKLCAQSFTRAIDKLSCCSA